MRIIKNIAQELDLSYYHLFLKLKEEPKALE
jgi:hypothetical protein